jgi:hypothetical protein
MKTNRPTALIVFGILSWLSLGLGLIGVVSNALSGPPTDEEIRQQEIQMLSELTPEMVAEAGWVVTETVDFLQITQDKFGILTAVTFIQVIVGLIAVIMMFKLRKIGFHLYIVYSLIALGYWILFFGHNTLGTIMAVISGIISGIFVLLYASQLKHMN